MLNEERCVKSFDNLTINQVVRLQEVESDATCALEEWVHTALLSVKSKHVEKMFEAEIYLCIEDKALFLGDAAI